MPMLAAVLLAGAAATPAAEPDYSAAIAALAAQFDTHRIVMVGEQHRSREIHAFLAAALRDPAFACRLDAIVVEFGNARLQPLADAYARSDPLTEPQLQSMWRETLVPLAWNAPPYRRFYEAVRELNASGRCPRPVRLLLGDAPVDWAAVVSPGDLAAFDDRDAALAGVVEREVLAKGLRALVVAGKFHALERLPEAEREDPTFRTTAERLESAHPGAVFSAIAVIRPEAAQRLGFGDVPDFRAIDGTDAASADASLARPKWTPGMPPEGVTLGEAADGLLWLGGHTDEFPSPTIYLEPAYQEELRRRARLIKAHLGQDFETVIDDLVRQAIEGGDGAQTNVP